MKNLERMSGYRNTSSYKEAGPDLSGVQRAWENDRLGAEMLRQTFPSDPDVGNPAEAPLWVETQHRQHVTRSKPFSAFIRFKQYFLT